MIRSAHARVLSLGLATLLAGVVVAGCKKANRDGSEVATAVERGSGSASAAAVGSSNQGSGSGGGATVAACQACAREKCAREAPGCQALKEPGKVALCEKLYACIKRTDCARKVAAHCWCGTTPIPECTVKGRPGDGACAAEEIAAAESTVSQEISRRYADNSYASGAANNLIICEQELCPAECGHQPPQ